MKNIGFYAPLKSPHHPNPSGDRLIARLLIAALEAAGHTVTLISEFRSWEGSGSLLAQQEIERAAQKEVDRLKNSLNDNPLDLIFTYHLYHKAPDLIAQPIARHFNIPYILCEASIAPKQAMGQWQSGYLKSLVAIKQATALISINKIDSQCLLPILKMSQRHYSLDPFLDDRSMPVELLTFDSTLKNTLREQWSNKLSTANTHLDPKKPWLISVAMMRDDVKAQSYKRLADYYKAIAHDFNIILVGDGNAKETIEKQFSCLKQGCFFTGKLTHEQIYSLLSAADIFCWPAINEAIGLSLLEAQAMGLPVIAHDYGDVGNIIEHDKSGFVIDKNQTDLFIDALNQLLSCEQLRQTMSSAARQNYQQKHSFDKAVESLNSIITSL